MAKKSARESSFAVLAGGAGAPAQSVDTSTEMVSIGRARATRMGLVMDERTNRPSWANIGRDLSVAADGIQWAVGDWLLFGEQRWGDMYGEAQEITGFSYGTLRNLKSIAQAYELSSRNDNLSFKHHVTVANHPDREVLLEMAAAQSWSTAELGRQARLMLPESKDAPPAWKRVLRDIRGRTAPAVKLPKAERRKVARQLKAWAEMILEGDELPEVD